MHNDKLEVNMLSQYLQQTFKYINTESENPFKIA